MGAFVLGPLGDKWGRRPCFTISVTIIALFGLLSAFSPNYGWMVFFRAMVGVGVGGLIVPFDLLAEFSPAELRGKYLLSIEYFWTVLFLLFCFLFSIFCWYVCIISILHSHLNIYTYIYIYVFVDWLHVSGGISLVGVGEQW